MHKPDHHRNHSDVPQGDDDPCREKERANTTNNKLYHGEVGNIFLLMVINVNAYKWLKE